MSKQVKAALLTVFSLFIVLICSDSFADESCITTGSDKVCGYDCKIAGGSAACASTPYGACVVAGGRVQCWDPPAWVHKKASCMIIDGEAVCGFECRIASGHATCSSPPYGACGSTDGRLFCWDPPKGVQKKAQCVASNGKSACGYDCTIAGGDVKCASTPDGKCAVKSGQVVCSDSNK